MADHTKYTSIFIIFMASFVFSSYAYQFNVGGKDGWVVNPSENYNHWAERMRFQVNDTLVFKYKKRSNSVLVVNKDDYDKCNSDKPKKKFDDGNSVFEFERSGVFYFISGNKTNCDQGQKFIIVVLATRNRQKPSAPTVSPISPHSTARAPAGSPGVSPPSNARGSPVPSPGPGSSGSPALTTSAVMVSTVSALVLIVTFGASIISF